MFYSDFLIQSKRNDRTNESVSAAVSISLEQHHQIDDENVKREIEKQSKKQQQTKQSTAINYFIMMILWCMLGVWVWASVHWSHLRWAHFDLICHTKFKNRTHTHAHRHTLNFYELGTERWKKQNFPCCIWKNKIEEIFYCIRENETMRCARLQAVPLHLCRSYSNFNICFEVIVWWLVAQPVSFEYFSFRLVLNSIRENAVTQICFPRYYYLNLLESIQPMIE